MKNVDLFCHKIIRAKIIDTGWKPNGGVVMYNGATPENNPIPFASCYSIIYMASKYKIQNARHQWQLC